MSIGLLELNIPPYLGKKAEKQRKRSHMEVCGDKSKKRDSKIE